MTQGDSLYPKTFNVLLYKVLQHWVSVVALPGEAVEPGAVVTGGFGQDIQHLAAYFYAGDGILTSTRVARLQQDFDTLTKNFDHVGLCINVSKKVIMDFWP